MKKIQGEGRLVSTANGSLLPRLNRQKVSKIPLKTRDDTNDTTWIYSIKWETIFVKRENSLI